jgi:hypothetical protein
MGFGAYGTFPFQFGGGTSDHEAVHRALLKEYEPGFDVSDGTIAYLEAYAEAAVIAQGWAATKRIGHQGQPLKMLEILPSWEAATGLRPGSSDTDGQRRGVLAGKLRGVSGNTMTDIFGAMSTLCGGNFVNVWTNPSTSDITYWPVKNPGPPGYEWTSNSRKIRVQLNTVGLTDSAFQALASTVLRQLGDMLPSDMSYGIFVADKGIAGTTQGFHVGVSRLGVNGL